MKLQHGIYVGEDSRLSGCGALIRDDPKSSTDGVLAQFDDLYLPMELTHNWTPFSIHDFVIDEEVRY